jgi:HEAT repeat protein
VKGAAPALHPRVSEESREVVERIDALRRRRDVDGLIRELARRSAATRADAAFALGRLGDRRAVEPLIRLLDDPDLRVRRHAVIALGSLGDPAAIGPLLAVSGDPLATARSLKTQTAASLLHPRAVFDEIEQFLATEESVREKAFSSLARLGAREIVPALVELLDHEAPHVRRKAAIALGRIGDPAAVPDLRRRVRREPPYRWLPYVRALRRIQRGSSSARP